MLHQHPAGTGINGWVAALWLRLHRHCRHYERNESSPKQTLFRVLFFHTMVDTTLPYCGYFHMTLDFDLEHSKTFQLKGFGCLERTALDGTEQVRFFGFVNPKRSCWVLGARCRSEELMTLMTLTR